MKLLEVFRIINESQFLIERDVINAQELKAWAKESAARLTDPQAATWYASQLSKYLINRYNEFRTAGLNDFDGDPPEWVVAKVQAGQGNEIIYVEPQQQLRQQAEGVIDWLNAQAANNESMNLRMTWEEAVEAQAEWHRDIARQSRVTELTKDQLEGIVTVMEFPDGYRWVDVQTEVCLQHEGTIMGHCVGQGGYTQGVQENTTKILSLRDANNNPHATIEGVSDHPIVITKDMLNSQQLSLFADKAIEQSFVDMSIVQIKGKENRPVVRKYRDYVQEFLTKFQIEKYGYGGLNDLENCGLFHLRSGGYANVEEIGELVVKMDDGTIWQRVDNEYVELKDYSENLDAKWYLYDKTGRSIGSMEEKIRGQINNINIGGFGATIPELMKYQEHVIAAFASKYDKGRSPIKPGGSLYQGFHNTLERFGLAVSGKLEVNVPQKAGKLTVQTEAGDVYATAALGIDGNMYWLMSGDNIKARFSIVDAGENQGYMLRFDTNHGIPNGSITSFIKKFESAFDGININYIEVQNNTIAVKDIEWTPEKAPSKWEFIMEEDGVKFYESEESIKGHKWYNAVDGHNQLIFNMSIGDTNFKTILVNNKAVAGYYAVYLLNHLDENDDVDIGHFTDYSSFARVLLDETRWFQGKRSLTWYMEDGGFPIHMTVIDTYDDGSEETRTDEDTIMDEYWTETQLYDSGLEEDYFAGEYEQVYRGGNIGYDDEYHPDEEEYEGRRHVRTDWYVEGIGNADTVTHPVSGGTVRIKR